MKQICVNAFSLADAEKKLNLAGYNNFVNLTDTFNHSGQKLNDFLEAAVTEDQKSVLIETVKGIPDTRIKPYTCMDFKMTGTTVKKRVFVIRLSEDNSIIGESNTKAGALKTAKQLMNTYKKDIYCVVEYHIVSGNERCFELIYTPSKTTAKGTYILSEYEAPTV